MKKVWVVALVLLMGCDQPTLAPRVRVAEPDEGGVAQPEPFEIPTKVWGSADAKATYFVRAMEDGAPALFDADGHKLMELLPSLVLDANVRGKRRAVPCTHKFELIALQERDDGGFTLLARAKDVLGTFDLRFEAGPKDPRIHLGVSTQWSEDVVVQRQIVRFAMGAHDDVRSIGPELQWAEAEDEWTTPAHAQDLVRFAGGVTAVSRANVDGLTVRSRAGVWDLDIEAYHYQAHPLGLGDPCDEELDGAAVLRKETRSELRVDFVLGHLNLPIVERWPGGKRGAASLTRTKEGKVTAYVAEPSPTWTPLKDVSMTSPDKLPCEAGRYSSLVSEGTRAALGGEGDQAPNQLAATQVDGRRVVAFRHPESPIPLFLAPNESVKPEWATASALKTLADERGLLLGHAEGLSDEVMSGLAQDSNLWLATPGELARRLVALEDVDLDLLPDGVIRVRNLGDAEVLGLTLRLSEGLTARGPDSAPVTLEGQLVWFDLPAEGEQLLQVSRSGGGTATLDAAIVTVQREKREMPDKP